MGGCQIPNKRVDEFLFASINYNPQIVQYEFSQKWHIYKILAHRIKYKPHEDLQFYLIFLSMNI